jgi:hypothetical protein
MGLRRRAQAGRRRLKALPATHVAARAAIQQNPHGSRTIVRETEDFFYELASDKARAPCTLSDTAACRARRSASLDILVPCGTIDAAGRCKRG